MDVSTANNMCVALKVNIYLQTVYCVTEQAVGNFAIWSDTHISV